MDGVSFYSFRSKSCMQVSFPLSPVPWVWCKSAPNSQGPAIETTAVLCALKYALPLREVRIFGGACT